MNTLTRRLSDSVAPWILCALLAAAPAACGGVDDAGDTSPETEALETPPETSEAGSSGNADALGTIQADVDGEARTWYVVEGTVRGEPYASGMFIPGGGRRLVTLGGFDTDDPPLDSFETDATAGNVSLGDYEGSAFNVMVAIPNGQSTAHAELRGMSGESALAYMPVAVTENVMSGTLFAQSGVIDVENARFDDTRGSLEGTFSGELALTDGSRSVTITNGRFEVSGIPRR